MIITKMSEYAVGKQLRLFESDVKAKRESGTLSCITHHLSGYQTIKLLMFVKGTYFCKQFSILHTLEDRKHDSYFKSCMKLGLN